MDENTHRVGDSVGTLAGKVACIPDQESQERQGRVSPGPLEGTWWPTELSEKRLKRVHSQSVGFDCAIQSVGFDCDSPGSEQGLEIKMVQWLDTLCSSEDLSLVPSPHSAGAQPPAPPVLGDLTPSFGLNSTHIYLANTLPHTCT